MPSPIRCRLGYYDAGSASRSCSPARHRQAGRRCKQLEAAGRDVDEAGLLDNWVASVEEFTAVAPRDYKRVLETIRAVAACGASDPEG